MDRPLTHQSASSYNIVAAIDAAINPLISCDHFLLSYEQMEYNIEQALLATNKDIQLIVPKD